MCNSYWRSQELLQEHGVEAFIQGMASQVAEREDHILVEDLRGEDSGLKTQPALMVHCVCELCAQPS